jgi:transposase
VEALSEDALEDQLYGAAKARATSKPLPDFVWVHAERAKTGVTLELLHQEYLESHPDGYRYTQYCDYYREWLASRGLTMRIEHRAGEKLFVDYSGKKPHYIDRATGEAIEVELFVAVLGASNYTFAEATYTQRGHDWIASHARAFAFFGGTAAMTVPDQLKSGVAHACLYEPAIQRTYEEMATHYGVSVFPARPKKPRDKAKVEVGVQVVQRWILARMRNQTFFSLDELNGRIAELLVDLNNRRMRSYGASRRELFERVDRPALRPLPEKPFTYAEWKKGRVNLDYHIEVDGHYYSVPSTHAREEVEIRFTATTVEVFLRGDRIAAHVRAPTNRGPLDRHTTVPDHMPASHRKHVEWTPTRILRWAETVGPSTTVLVTAILSERPHPEQGYRSCLGILRLGGRYGNDRLERACQRAFGGGARSYRHVDTILKNGLDRLEDDAPAETKTVQHSNVRGGSYYH